MPPSPRHPSVVKIPTGTIAVGWNWIASMFPRVATPLSRAIACPIPWQITAFVETL